MEGSIVRSGAISDAQSSILVLQTQVLPSPFYLPRSNFSSELVAHKWSH
jgi:hypothetical protein